MVEPPRYEYRVWGNSFLDLRNYLQRLAAGSPVRASIETYLISERTDKCNLKIRAGRINLKLMLAEENGLELWRPMLDGEFPLDGRTITDQIFPHLELRSPDLERSAYSVDEFLKEVIRPEPSIAMVPIVKKRSQFRLDESLAEFTSVAVGQREHDTVAVESTNPDAVLRLVRQLGIIGMPNTSYIRQLKQITGDHQNIIKVHQAQTRAK